MTGTSGRTPQPARDPSIGVYVSLYLILVAFFMVMNAISNQQTARAVAVMASLDRAFERPFQRQAEVPDLLADARADAVAAEFANEAAALLESVLALRDRGPAPGGTRLKVAVPAQQLFFVDRPVLSEQAAVLLDQLVPLVQRASDGERREVTFFFPAGAETALSIARADVLAQRLEEAGMPASSFAVGLAPGPADQITLVFQANSLKETRISFDGDVR